MTATRTPSRPAPEPVASERSAPPPAGRSAAATKTVPPAADVSPFAMGLLLRQAHEQVAEAMDEVLRPFGIERRHLMVLMRLDADGPLSQRDLVVLTRHDKASMVRIVDDLERLGLASREAVVGDRRLRAVTLTDEGRRVFADAHRAATPAADSALQPLTAGEIAQLRGLLRRLTSR